MTRKIRKFDDKKIRVRIGVVIIADNKLLLVEHQKEGRTYWLLPGGGLKFGEKIEECARREIKEETNLDIDMGKFLFLSEGIAPDGSRHILNLFFLGELRGGTLEVGSDTRLKSVAFHELDDLDQLKMYPAIGNLLKQTLRNDLLREDRKQYLGNMWTK